jgi:ABC-type transport system involved in multi-copper enzyme maturation permease subunit
LVPVGFIFAEYLGELGTLRGGGRAGNPYQLSAAMNVYVRVLGTTVACLMLLAVGARAAGSVSGERDRQTLDALLTSPLEISAILYAKWIGNILTVRKAWLWLGAIYLLGLATGGLHPFALPLLLAAWFVFAAVVSAMGIWFSIVSRTTLRATIWTLFTTGGAALGHWLLWMCCAPIFIYAGNSDGAYLRWVLSFQVGMTPPAVLGYAFSFSIEDFSGQYSQSREMGEALGFGILGLIIWAIIAAVIWAAASSRFATITGRLGLARAQLPRNSMPPLDARPESPAGAKLDVRDSTVG